jgi:heme-degrading monooxygenase HmoA
MDRSRKVRTVILEHALLNVLPGRGNDFLATFTEASSIIRSMDGCLGVRLLRCHENTDEFLLLVEWETVEHHTVGFRQSEQYQRWRALLHHFYEPFPEVLHFEELLLAQ